MTNCQCNGSVHPTISEYWWVNDHAQPIMDAVGRTDDKSLIGTSSWSPAIRSVSHECFERSFLSQPESMHVHLFILARRRTIFCSLLQPFSDRSSHRYCANEKGHLSGAPFNSDGYRWIRDPTARCNYGIRGPSWPCRACWHPSAPLDRGGREHHRNCSGVQRSQPSHNDLVLYPFREPAP